MAGCHFVLDVGEARQSVAVSVAGTDPRDPTWRPGDPTTAEGWRDLIRQGVHRHSTAPFGGYSG
ncbi:hypothetical protein KI387_043932 [Taxus chinensis]|uniref:Uncharacterized protein n=1 Tax=Taxus chinensis TaxID=29808 RepID=A0AA38LHN4_TAXCH|nr:hypothetical protein KI387_043932 [Taxus chinensis]